MIYRNVCIQFCKPFSFITLLKSLRKEKLDAGVPIISTVAGVAMGLVTSYNDNNRDIGEYKILTDILGIEDYLGDMDLKVAGTKRGFTAFQADVKIPGVPLKIVSQCISQATDKLHKIIKIMNEVRETPQQSKKDKRGTIKGKKNKLLIISKESYNRVYRVYIPFYCSKLLECVTCVDLCLLEGKQRTYVAGMLLCKV